jgi:drug/metabolite transporter (DMT)-like permease
MLLIASFTSTCFIGSVLLATRARNWRKLFESERIKRAALLGLLNPFIYYLVLFEAYDRLPGQVAQSLNYCWPIILVVLAVTLLGQKISKSDGGALFFGLLGVVIISTQKGSDFTGGLDPLGITLALGAAVVWALYWVLSFRNATGSLADMMLGFLFGTIYTIVYLLIAGEPISYSLKGMMGSIYIGLFEMGVTFCLWLRALSLSTNHAKIGMMIYLAPFISLLFLHFIAGEPISSSTFLGLVIIVTGIILQKSGKLGRSMLRRLLGKASLRNRVRSHNHIC